MKYTALVVRYELAGRASSQKKKVFFVFSEASMPQGGNQIRCEKNKKRRKIMASFLTKRFQSIIAHFSLVSFNCKEWIRGGCHQSPAQLALLNTCREKIILGSWKRASRKTTFSSSICFEIVPIRPAKFHSCLSCSVSPQIASWSSCTGNEIQNLKAQSGRPSMVRDFQCSCPVEET